MTPVENTDAQRNVVVVDGNEVTVTSPGPQGVPGPAADAGDITYDNAGSGLAATDVEAALDELDADVASVESSAASNASGIATNAADIATLQTRDMPTGGTAGQFMQKDSGTDYDVSWHTLEAADISDFASAVTDAQGYTAFVYNSSGAQSGNRYNDFGDLMATAALFGGEKRIFFEQNEVLPAGAWSFNNITFVGNGAPVGGGALVVEAPTGFTITDITNFTLTTGMTFVSTSTTYLHTVTSGAIFGMERNSGIACTTSPMFYIAATAQLFVIGARDGSGVWNAGAGPYGGSEVVEVDLSTPAFATIGMALNGTSPVFEDNTFIRPGVFPIARLIQSSRIDMQQGTTQTNAPGGLFTLFFTFMDTLQYDNTTSGLAATTGQAAIDELAANTPTVVTAAKTSDETRNSTTTVADDSELVLALEANERYAIEATLIVSAHATPDFKFALTGTGTSTIWWTSDLDNDEAGPLGAGNEQSVNGAGADTMVTLMGTIRVGGTAGNLSVQWAQDTSDANDTTLKDGSWIKATKL